MFVESKFQFKAHKFQSKAQFKNQSPSRKTYAGEEILSTASICGVARKLIWVALIAMFLPLAVHAEGKRLGFGDADPVYDWLRSSQLDSLADASEERLASELFRVYTVDHRVDVGEGVVVHVTEHFTLYSWLMRPRRGVVFLSGSAFKGNHWSIPVEGYDATRMMAERGVFAYTVDHLGVGSTTAPADGTDVTFEGNIEMVTRVVEAIRFSRRIPRLDLIGAGYGGSIAAHVAADSRRVRSCVMTAMLYTDLVGGPLTDPGFVAFLENAPNGYVDFPAPAYLPVIGAAPAAVQQYVLESQPGVYPAHNFLVATHLPFFDPGKARAPGLVIYGSEDTVGGPSDPYALASDYGRYGAELLIIDGASHATRMDPPEIAAQFWDAIFEFIDVPDPQGN